LVVADNPTDATTKAVQWISKLVSIPTYANLAGQSAAAILEEYVYWSSGDRARADATAAVIRRNLRSQLREELGEKLAEHITKRGFEALEFENPEAVGQAFSEWAKAAKSVLKESPEAAQKLGEPTIEYDGKGGRQTREFEGTNSVPISGTVSDPVTGAPQPDSQVQACPALPGQVSQAPRTQGATYDDGSYAVIVPVDFTAADSKLCKLIIRPANGERGTAQAGFVSLNSGPKVINFPDNSPPGDVKLRGADSGTGVYSDCGATQEVGLLSLDITLHNLSWTRLLREGGEISGEASYRRVSSSCASSSRRINYGEEIAFGVKVGGKMAAGGKGDLTIGAVAYNVSLTETGLQGTLTPASLVSRCQFTIQCTFQLQLNVVR
jgi:hypothetical protein